MSSPELSPQPAPPAAPVAAAPSEHHALLERVRRAQRKALLATGAAGGLALGIVVFVSGVMLAPRWPSVGATLTTAAFFIPFLVFLGALEVARRRIGNAERTARLVAQRMPELGLDVLAAVELSRALSRPADFSLELATQFLRDISLRAASTPIDRAVDSRLRKTALALLGVAVFIGVGVRLSFPARWAQGTQALTRKTTAVAAQAREPITGQVELSYRYPAYTGLPNKTVTGSDITALKGTLVSLKTRADRDVSEAAIDVNGKRTALQVSGRDLSGTFLVETTGTWHFVFLKGSRVVATGPSAAITAEADLPPDITLNVPSGDVELDPKKQQLELQYRASDDFGLGAVTLVYKPPGAAEVKVELTQPNARRTTDDYSWDLHSLKLQPGQVVSYFLSATDNDAISGPKTSVSRTLTVKLYDAAEHRREAMRLLEGAWDKLVSFLGERMEAPDRDKKKPLPKTLGGQHALDEKGLAIATDFLDVGERLRSMKDAPDILLAAAVNAGQKLRAEVRKTSEARTLAEKFSGRGNDGLYKRFSAQLELEIAGSEATVLYLEGLLDREKLNALKELAQKLKEDRRELSRLLEDFKKSATAEAKDAVLSQMKTVRQRIDEISRQMAALSKGIRDEKLNAEALKEMEQQTDLGDALDEVSQLLSQGKTEEAEAKLQELSMDLDQMSEKLEQAADDEGGDGDPELEKKFGDFMQDLGDTERAQQQTMRETAELKNKAAAVQKKEFQQKAAALKAEFLKTTQDAQKTYKAIDTDRLGSRGSETMNQEQDQLAALEQALQSNDFDLAAEVAQKAARRAEQLSMLGDIERRQAEVFNSSPADKKAAQKRSDTLNQTGRKISAMSEKLSNLFPQDGAALSESDQQKLKSLAQEQAKLEKRGQQLKQDMDELGEMAPLFDKAAKELMEQAASSMGEAANRLGSKDARRGHSAQGQAVDGLEQLKQSIQQAQRGGGRGKGRIPRPMMAGQQDGRGRRSDDKVEIPDEEKNASRRDFRKDLLDAMKETAPPKYQEQVKKYYEELVK